MAGHGYAFVRVDLRETGESAGILTDEFTLQELADACKVIEWLTAQDWCSGAVGVMGKSRGGINALQTAFLRPPALKAVIAVCAATDRFGDGIHFKGRFDYQPRPLSNRGAPVCRNPAQSGGTQAA